METIPVLLVDTECPLPEDLSEAISSTSVRSVSLSCWQNIPNEKHFMITTLSTQSK